MHILWYRYPSHWDHSNEQDLTTFAWQKSQVTTVPTHAAVTPTAAAPIDATPIVTPIAAAIAPIAATVAPIAATVALNATMLQHPQRQRQLPLRFHNNSAVRTGTSHMPDDREYIDIGNVSGDKEDNLLAPSVRAPPVPSPLQTVTSTIYSTQVDPLATGVQGMQPKSTADINHFFREDSATKHKICRICEDLQKVDSSHQVMSYKHSTGTSARHTHAFYHHTDIFLQEAERLRWPIYVQPLNERLAEGWTLAAIHERHQDPAYYIELLGTIPNQGHGNFLPGTTLSPDNYIPDFSIDEMHRQLVKFIVADDQAS
ncbi:uncharacterized protein EDB91DRAFT_1078605 [Suillus paluster]|uniref:uncharacterized protein n=1 Tax=Suillus paluster TaxID=48578 RepID=UPI001B8645ED|nr:uncharacterized protein EDB91DRAFT_1078605 [Suillus paluster]KAG1750589.1 hypothetical protein EDB91DRAFT_1078605 [Suillus paluster]